MRKLEISAILLLTLLGFALRLYYLTTTHPFFDEYTTVLAAREILRHGWPVLPSGLFYEHGLLATYLIVPFTALFINTPLSQWQSADWGLMLARWPSVFIGTITIPLIFVLGRRSFNLSPLRPVSLLSTRRLSSAACLLAAGLFAFSPEGMVWGGRARMYALATLLVLWAVYWAYQGAIYPAPAKYRWWAWLALLAALLTQLGVLTLIPPLLVAMLVVGWRSSPRGGQWSRLWFLRPGILLEALAVLVIIGLAIYVKRLGQPIGFAPLADPASGSLPEELLKTTAYRLAFHLNWADTVKFFAREFGIPHHFWLALTAVVGLVATLVLWLVKQAGLSSSRFASLLPSDSFSLFLWFTFGLILFEIVIFLDPLQRNTRYIVMYLPLFYLIAAYTTMDVWYHILRIAYYVLRNTQYVLTTTALILLILFATLGYSDLRLALDTPEPAYEQAMAFVRREWQPGDVLLTMNTPAAALYLGRADGFTIQNDAEQFLLNANTAPIDRWLGTPWLGTAADFNAALNTGQRAWFVIDTVRLPVYFRGDWLAVVNNQMEQVWANDNVLVYLTRPDRLPLPSRPDTLINATLGDSIQLTGYTLDRPNESDLRLILFWQALAQPAADYTVFLHLRKGNGATIAQHDGQPLDGVYPTGRWQPGETVIDPITLPLPPDLPAGTYTLVTGLYQLDTLQRLPLANDTSGENAIVLGEVSLP